MAEPVKTPASLAYKEPSGAALRAQANTQITQEIAGQVDPLQSLVDQYGAQSDKAVGQLDQLYTDPATGLQPQVEKIAADLKQNWGNLNANQSAVFNEASARLNALRQQRSQEAQTLAQQLGAPVPTSMFADPVDQEIGLSVAEFGGGMLNAMGLASAGVQQAEAFSGQVFPMMRARQTEEVKSFFRDKISTLQDQIAAIKGQKAGLVSKRQRELLVQDREFSLQKTQANRDWYMARLQASERQQQLQLQYDQLNAQVADANADRAAREKAARDAAKTKTSLDYAQRQDTALKYLDAMLSPGSHKVTIQTGVDADGNPVYKDVLQQGDPMTDPNRIMEQIMTAAGVNKNIKKNKQFAAWLQQQIRIKGIAMGKDWAKDGWVYGSGGKVTQANIESGAKTLKQWQAINLDRLNQLAVSLFGFKGNWPKNAITPAQRQKWLAQWVWQKQEKALAETIRSK